MDPDVEMGEASLDKLHDPDNTIRQVADLICSEHPTQIGTMNEPSQQSTDLYNMKTAKDRPQPRPVPHFHELEDIDFRQPLPGTYRFPDSEFENGWRKPFKQLHQRSDILPPKDEPFFVQIQTYCQRWTVWAACIVDEERRKEVLDCVLTKMVEAWKFGVLNGHYNFGPFEAAEKERLLKESRQLKRNVDTARKAAPFVAETGFNKDYNIVNGELEKAGITMEMINKRIENDELGEGDVLLQTITRRLQRDLELGDWKQNIRFAFKASNHQRNLFMYALWEVQRCRRLITNLETKLEHSASKTQQKAWRSRIETNRTRSMQHMALAIELNLKEPIETAPSEEEEATDSDPDSAAGKNGPSNSEYAPADTSVYPEDTAMHSSPGYSTGTIGDQDTTMMDHVEHDDSYATLKNTDFDLMSGDMGPNLSGLARLPELPELPPEFSFDFSTDLNASEKRSQDELGNDIEEVRKRQKLDHLDLAWQDSDVSPHSIATPCPPTSRLIDPRHIARAALSVYPESYDNWLEKDFDPTPIQPQTGTKVDDEAEKCRYLAEVWRPKLDDLLRQRGQEPLQQPLSKWSDVRSILMDLKISSASRNAYLREYKSGMQARGIARKDKHDRQLATQQYQPPQTKLTLKLPVQQSSDNHYPDHIVNETRGFSFRCLPEASTEQRARLDDLINDYVTEIIASRYRRHGMYVIMHDPEHPNRMPIAHGFWNYKDKSHVDNASWFYNGQPIPSDLDLEAYHIHDFEQAPPTTPKRSRQSNSGTAARNSTRRGGFAAKNNTARSRRRADAGHLSRQFNNYPTFDDPNDSDFDPTR